MIRSTIPKGLDTLSQALEVGPITMLAVRDPQGGGWWLYSETAWNLVGWDAKGQLYDTLVTLAQENHLLVKGYDVRNNHWILETT